MPTLEIKTIRALAAALIFSPALLFAQASTSVQPAGTPVMEAALVYPAAAPAAMPSAEKPAEMPAPAPIRLATRATPPTLIHAVSVLNHADFLYATFGGDHTVVIDMTVDETGKPAGLKVAKSANKMIDGDVLAAVREYRYQPATVDGTPVAVPLRLRVVVQHNRGK